MMADDDRSRRWPLEIVDASTGGVDACAVNVELTPSGDGSLTVDLPDGGDRLTTPSTDLEAAIGDLRRQLDGGGWLLCCNRFRRDAVVSGMANGLACYLRRDGRPFLHPSLDLVESLAPAPRHLIVTGDEADRAAERSASPARRLREAITMSERATKRFERTVEQRSAALERRLDEELWFEPAQGVAAPEVGTVYRAVYPAGHRVFLLAVDRSDDAVGVVPFDFVVGDADYVPDALFDESYLLDAYYSVEASAWADRLLDPVGSTNLASRRHPAEPAGPSAGSATDVCSPAELSRAVVNDLGFMPWAAC